MKSGRILFVSLPIAWTFACSSDANLGNDLRKTPVESQKDDAGAPATHAADDDAGAQPRASDVDDEATAPGATQPEETESEPDMTAEPRDPDAAAAPTAGMMQSHADSGATSDPEPNMGMTGMGDLDEDSTSQDAPRCEINTVDTNQGQPPANNEECAEIGTALKDAHDAALQGEVLEVQALAGTWVVGSGVERIELVLEGTGAGTLRFGDEEYFPTISDPDATFLTIGSHDASGVFGYEHLGQHMGFAYSVIAENGRSSEMSFHISTMQAFEDWCALQSPVASPLGRACYACMADEGVYSLVTEPHSEDGVVTDECGPQIGCYAGVSETGDAEELERVDCGRFELCIAPYHNACNCTAEECFANVEVRDQLTEYPYSVSLDPVDTSVLRLESLSELVAKTTFYLTKQESE